MAGISLLDVMRAREQNRGYYEDIIRHLVEAGAMSPGEMFDREMAMRGGAKLRELEAMRIEEEMETHIKTICEKCGNPATLIISDVTNAFVESTPYRINHNGKHWSMTLAEIRSKGFGQLRRGTETHVQVPALRGCGGSRGVLPMNKTGFEGLDSLLQEIAERARHERDRERFAAAIARFVQDGERAREALSRPDTPALQAYFR